MKKYNIKTVSTILYVLLITCPLIALGLGLLPIDMKNTYTDYAPILLLNCFYIVWFIVILCSFLLPIIKKFQEEKGHNTSNILFDSGTLVIGALVSLLLIDISGFTYLFYIGLRAGTFHAS